MGSLYGRRESRTESGGHRGVARPRASRLTLLTCGPALCDLRYWTESEWAALAEGERPRQWAHAPGRGWFGAVPVVGMN